MRNFLNLGYIKILMIHAHPENKEELIALKRLMIRFSHGENIQKR